MRRVEQLAKKKGPAVGDAINAVLAAAGYNLRKLLGLYLRKAGRLVFALIRWYRNLVDWTRNLIVALADRRSLLFAAA